MNKRIYTGLGAYYINEKIQRLEKKEYKITRRNWVQDNKEKIFNIEKEY